MTSTLFQVYAHTHTHIQWTFALTHVSKHIHTHILKHIFMSHVHALGLNNNSSIPLNEVNYV